MLRCCSRVVLLVLLLTLPLCGAEVRLVERKPDPYGSPRPARDAKHVPLRTSIYFELALKAPAAGDRRPAENVTVSLETAGGEARELLAEDRKFAAGVEGWLRPHTGGTWTIYIDPRTALAPDTTYTVRVKARSQAGVELAAQAGTWSFTTEAAAAEHTVELALDLSEKPVHWQGGFFTGICNVVFTTRDEQFGPLWDMMAAAQAEHPRAWRYRRDLWLTANDDRKPEWHAMMEPGVPNLVRELQTRRITKLEERDDGVLVHLEDFFGHEQYGVESGGALSADYQPGSEVLMADGVHDARRRVLAVDDDARTLKVAKLPAAEPAWLLEYQTPPPKTERPDQPGLFVAGGTHLRRFDPPGTPVYFWKRLDKEFDLAHRRLGGRIVVDFVEAPIDMSLTGREYTRPKDYAVWHEVARTVAGHIIDRYGEAACDFPWAVFNEADIVGEYWRQHWDEVQRFYDYTVDGVLRAFEDRGYDSKRVQVGGLELGAIFGTNLRLAEFYAHCSPKAEAKGALEENAAVADRRLDGKRSRRVEELCRAHDGRGSPCDFVSVHTYNASAMAAAKMIRAKELALEADAEFYEKLWIDSHESCPNWSPPPDTAAADSYLGNGYFPSWTLDMVHRQLVKAAADPRYAMGESVMTIWPPPIGFGGLNTLARHVAVDDDGDGRSDRTVSIASPIFHAINLLTDLGPDYWVLPPQEVAGHALGGFASRGKDGKLRVALASHAGEDTQSRSEQTFRVALELKELGAKGPLRVTQHRFDRRQNTYFAEAAALRDQPLEPEDAAKVERLRRVLEEENDVAKLHALLDEIRILDVASLMELAPAFMQMTARVTDPELRAAIDKTTKGLFNALAVSPGYPAAKIKEIQRLAELRATAETTATPAADGSLQLTVELSANGVNFVTLEARD